MRCIEYWAFNWETDVWLNSRENDNRANTAATTTAHTHTHNSQWKTNLLSLSLVGCTFKMTLQMRACQSDQVLKSIQIVCMWICLNEPAEAILFRCFKYIFYYLSLFFPIWFGLWFFNPFCCCLNFIFHNFFAISPYLRHIVQFIFTLFLISFQVFLHLVCGNCKNVENITKFTSAIEGETMGTTIFRSISNCKWYAQ